MNIDLTIKEVDEIINTLHFINIPAVKASSILRLIDFLENYREAIRFREST